MDSTQVLVSDRVVVRPRMWERLWQNGKVRNLLQCEGPPAFTWITIGFTRPREEYLLSRRCFADQVGLHHARFAVVTEPDDSALDQSAAQKILHLSK